MDFSRIAPRNSVASSQWPLRSKNEQLKFSLLSIC
ncbi:hypothetical protein ebA5079 [Aromatoleum aromaticum EbN1]|uniref:Uncharacterized protein n=1 Tax=Aromatoleum aromaticum (strain DSM 19018 / LMG 30748 / EbN1) TaxID=76114 RepID=Q5P111_AROAE|nr:hypothetical protein ebA5079 [Aromatoleum aromaticum EbN1]